MSHGEIADGEMGDGEIVYGEIVTAKLGVTEVTTNIEFPIVNKVQRHNNDLPKCFPHSLVTPMRLPGVGTRHRMG